MSFFRPRQGRRSLVAGLALALGTSIALLPASAAQAATPFIVIGTSDVSDSGLVAQVIEPRFEALYPQYDLQYIALGTGAALDSARAGNGAAVIVHAAALENQFVAAGYSLEPYGRSLFWGDYVLAGPARDPAGVLSAAPHDVVGALEKVAAAGAAGKAQFISRGKKPGTAVQERALWGLTTGVTTCAVDASNGNGLRPSISADPCPNPDTPSTYPSWYETGDAGSQAANVNIANTCSTGNGDCYVFTDRGTLAYLQSIGAAQNLKILVRDNDSAARGGVDALVNAFHVYGVNPAKFGNPAATRTDPAAAKLFLDFMTSQSLQEAFGDYLNATGDGPFIPAAAPQIDVNIKGDEVRTGAKSKIKGTLTNAIPGYPALAGVPVTLTVSGSDSALAIPRVVSTTTTNGQGKFKFKSKLRGGKTYRIGVGAISRIQLPLLSPQFGDTTVATTGLVGNVGGVALSSIEQNSRGQVVLSGKIKPKTDGRKGKLRLYAARPGSKLRKVALVTLDRRTKQFVLRDNLAPGRYRMQVVYSEKGSIVTGRSKVITVTLS